MSRPSGVKSGCYGNQKQKREEQVSQKYPEVCVSKLLAPTPVLGPKQYAMQRLQCILYTH